MPPEDVKNERRDSEHKGKRGKGGTVKEMKGNGYRRREGRTDRQTDRIRERF